MNLLEHDGAVSSQTQYMESICQEKGSCFRFQLEFFYAGLFADTLGKTSQINTENLKMRTKKINLIIIYLLVSVALAFPMVVQAQISFADNGDGTATLTGCDPNYAGALAIPSTNDMGLLVTIIGPNAFYRCTNLGNIVIPDSVTSIGRVAFYGCTSLTNVTLGNGITMIDYHAFDSCASLNNLTIPNSVTDLGEGAFWYCSSLSRNHAVGIVPPLGY